MTVDSLDDFLHDMEAFGTWNVDPNACTHESHIPKFDEVVAKSLSTAEVHKRFPRFEGICATCGVRVIIYASAAHFVAGDW